MIKKRFILLILMFISIFSITSIYGETLDKKTYTVGYFGDGYPIQYIDENDNAKGITIDIMKLIAEESNIDFEFIPIVTGTSQEIVANLDMIISFTQSNEYATNIYTTNERSLPYYSMPLFLSGLYGFEFSDEKVAVGMFDYIYLDDSSVHKLLPQAEIYRYKNIADLEEALYNKDIDFAFTTNLTMQMLLRADVNNEIQSYPVTFTIPLEIIFGDNFSQENQDMINDSILGIDNDMLNKVILENSYDYSLDNEFLKEKELYNSQEMTRNIIATIVIIVIIGVILIQIYRYHLEKITFFDKITGLHTEIKFSLEVSKILHNAKSNEYTMISADIDNFKYINEMYDFEIGTNVLKKFATLIRKNYPKTVAVSRVHADNFLILVKTQDLINNVNDFVFGDFSDILTDTYHIYFSQGTYEIADPNQLLTTIVDSANFARNIGKDTHGNTIVEFTDKMNRARQVQNKILSNMERALVEKEFEVFYQPKIDLNKKQTCGAEALIRWVTKGNQTIYPDEFIPLFEKNRYIIKLDFYVFREVCEFISNHRDEIKDVVVSVNLSTVTLLLDNIETNLLSIVKEYNVPIELVEVEITESAFIDNLELVQEQVRRLKNVGFTIALDDFGSGISSLNQLKNIEIDVLKIDKAFLSDSLEENKGIIVIKNVINLAKNLNLKTVAEGVETLESANTLAELGCDIAQGYYYGRPMPLADFREFLKIESFD